MTIDATKYVAHLHPGKFEAETPATEYFYEQMCDGSGETIYPASSESDGDAETDDWNTCAELFQIDSDESDAFGLTCGHWFLLREDSQGYAIGSEHATRGEAEHKFNEWTGSPCPKSCEVCGGAS